MKISVVIAAYDEVANVEPLFRRLEAALGAMPGVTRELIFVVEGRDGTREALERLSAGSPGVVILYGETPSGLGVAFRRGFAAVADDADYVITLDADLNHQPEEIPTLLEALRARESDIVVGSRFVAGSEVEGTPFWKRALSGFVNWMMGWFYGLAIRDKSSGFRIYRAEALRRISFKNDAFAFLPEILIHAARRGMKISEVPIHFTFRRSGSSKMAFWPTSWSYLRLFFVPWRRSERSAALPKKISRHRPLAAVLALAALLRVVGLGWSLPSPDYRHRLFHPDENWAMRNLSKINLKAGRLSPGQGQREGALYYYVWLSAAELLRKAGIVEAHVWRMKNYGDDYSTVLYTGRLLNAMFELITTILIYLTALKMTRRESYAALAAAMFAVFPFEVIYSHYVRTHAMANMFVALIVFLAFRLHDTQSHARSHFVIGLATGLGAAVRWTTAYALVIPLTVVLLRSWPRLREFEGAFHRRICRLFKESGLIFAAPGLFLGMLAGNPYFLISFRAVRRHLKDQMQYADMGQFSLASLLDLDRLWTTVHYLIPYGALPLLWAVLYLGAFFALISRAKYGYTIPLVVFVASYLYVIAKAYRYDFFVREAMPSFPALVLLAVIGIQKLVEGLRRFRIARVGVWAMALAALVSTFLFSLDYVLSMARPDSRASMHRFIAETPEMRGQSVAVFPSPKSYFIADPVFADIPEAVGVSTRECRIDMKDVARGEYLLFADFQSVDLLPRTIKAKETLLSSTEYVLVAEFDNTPRTMRWARQYLGRAPHDMQYPFPVISLFRRQ